MVGRFHFSCDRSESGVVALLLKEKAKLMTQHELNRQISKQTGESITEIARRGFTILKELPEDNEEPRQRKPPTTSA